MLFGGDGLQKGFCFGSTIFISFPIKCLVDQAILIGVLGVSQGGFQNLYQFVPSR